MFSVDKCSPGEMKLVYFVFTICLQRSSHSCCYAWSLDGHVGQTDHHARRLSVSGSR